MLYGGFPPELEPKPAPDLEVPRLPILRLFTGLFPAEPEYDEPGRELSTGVKPAGVGMVVVAVVAEVDVEVEVVVVVVIVVLLVTLVTVAVTVEVVVGAVEVVFNVTVVVIVPCAGVVVVKSVVETVLVHGI